MLDLYDRLRLCIHTQQPMQPRTAGCVLQLGIFSGEDNVCSAKGGQSAFVKATQNEFFFAWVGVDVAHRKDAAYAGGKFFCIY